MPASAYDLAQKEIGTIAWGGVVLFREKIIAALGG